MSTTDGKSPGASTPREPITFYLPYGRDGIASIPVHADEYWPWLLENRHISKGKYSWTLQTFLRLHDAGFPCELSERFPSSGIVISHRDFLPIFLRPRANVFLICIKPDRKEHTWAHFHIVQNDSDRILRTRQGSARAAMIPYWPQPGLLRRNPARAAQCENVAYFGRSLNLAPELRTDAWKRHLHRLGFNWSLIDFERWNDYRDIDATVSIRSLGGLMSSTDPIFDPTSKPPSKLINSWLAGVPALVGCESAYRQVRRCNLDFIEFTTTTELTEALVRLRDSKLLYDDMVANGIARATDYTESAVCRQWEQLFMTRIAGCVATWRKKSGSTRYVESIRGIASYFAKMQHLKDLLTIFR